MSYQYAPSCCKFQGSRHGLPYDTIRYNTIEEFNVDSKAEYTA